jgi:hypothetical protein
MRCASMRSGWAPTIRPTVSPPRTIAGVGMLRASNRAAACGFSSTLTLTTFT